MWSQGSEWGQIQNKTQFTVKAGERLTFVQTVLFRYNEAKDLAKNLEKQANKVQAEAEDAGNQALKIFANLTSLPPFDTKALEVSSDQIHFSLPSLLQIVESCFCVQDEASKIKKEAADLDKLIDKTEKEYNDLRDDLKGKELEVRRLLEKGKSEQQVG